MIEFKKASIRKWIVGLFISVPILSSLISTIHIVEFFNLGNYTWMSYVLAAAFELGSIAAFLVLGVLPNIQKWMLWTIFTILAGMQLVGNIFFSFDFVYRKLLEDPKWLDSFNAFMGYFTGNDALTNKMVLAFLIGLPIPLISLFFLKSTADYLKEDIEVKEEINIEPLEKMLKPSVEQDGDDIFVPIPVHPNIREWPEDLKLEDEYTEKQAAFEEQRDKANINNHIQKERPGVHTGAPQDFIDGLIGPEGPEGSNEFIEEPKSLEENKIKEDIYKEEPVEKINHKETTIINSSPDMLYNNKIKN
jgi:hypothetical protein